MAKPSDELALVPQAKKEVAFETDYLHPKVADGLPITDLHRRPSVPFSANYSPDTDDEASEASEAASLTADDYTQWFEKNRELFDYPPDDEFLKEDLMTKVDLIAVNYLNRHEKIGFEFHPISRIGKEQLQWPDFVDDKTFTQTCKDPAKWNAFYREFKARVVALEARNQQAEQLNSLCQAYSDGIHKLDQWVRLFMNKVEDPKEGSPGHDANALKEALDANTVLTEALTAQTAKIHELEAAVVRLTVSGRSVSPIALAGGKSSKLVDAAVFYNEPSKDTTTFEVWHRQISNKLEANADHFPTERMKMAYIEGRLGGKASMDLQPYLRDTYPNQITTASKLMEHLYCEYLDTNVKEDSLSAFIKLKYQPGTDFKEFKNEFVRLAGEIRRHKDTWKEELNTRLPASLQIAMTRDYVDDAVDFEQFSRMASAIIVSWKRSKQSQNPRSNTPGGSGGSQRRQKPNSGSAPKGRFNANKPSPEEAKKLVAEGRCFICRSQGHRARECPKKDQSFGLAPKVDPAKVAASSTNCTLITRKRGPLRS
jgi:transposase-like protein